MTTFKVLIQVIIIFYLSCNVKALAQGFNHNWLLGYDIALVDTNVISTKAIIEFTNVSATVIPSSFKMPFMAAQGNISDSNGNLLMVSNGCWIADATLDTMQNGSNLNPNSFTDNWCDNITGIPYFHSNIFLPFPGDSTKYILFHMTGNHGVNNFKSSEVYYTIVDMTLNGGLGGVPQGQKNIVVTADTLLPLMAVCRHANGRDWWIVNFEDNTSNIYTTLLTPSGVTSVTSQTLNVPIHFYNMGQANFSPDGTKFAYHYRDFATGGLPVTHQMRLFDFDRCSGLMSNAQMILHVDSAYSGNGLAFSSNSKYLYFTTFTKVFQLNTDTLDVQASLTQVAEIDTFYSPYPPYLTNFWMLNLAANGKIYISSGNSVIDIGYINQPDSSGLSCDVQQHALHLPCFYFRGHVYHPNYYLGCDTTSGCQCLTSLPESNNHDFKISIMPNPSSGPLKIAYLLPQNQDGFLQITDIVGRVLFSSTLSPWSTLQSINLDFLAGGLYVCTISSEQNYVSRKFVISDK